MYSGPCNKAPISTITFSPIIIGPSEVSRITPSLRIALLDTNIFSLLLAILKSVEDKVFEMSDESA